MALFVCLFFSSCQTSPPYRGRLSGAGFFDTVIIDAGHGGQDRGAKAVQGNHEKILSLDIAKRVSRILRNSGLQVIETRKGDYFVTLDDRVAISNRSRNAVFVSLHLNWAKRTRASGVEAYFYSDRSSRLAANIQTEVLRAYGTKNRGIKPGRFYVLRNNRRPAVLVEMGFVSNPAENLELQKSSTRQKIAEAVARGILAEKSGRTP